MIARKMAIAVSLIFTLTYAFGAARRIQAQDPKDPYPKMAPLKEYLMERSAEISLARSAAPSSVSGHATILVLDPKGYETAVKGTNGFVCAVERSWDGGTHSPQFWNPRIRAPICFNAPAARWYLPIANLKTKLVLAGKSRTQMVSGIDAAFQKNQLPKSEPGGMCFMMSRQQYLGDHGKHWYPHLMFLHPSTKGKAWGAGLPASPVFAIQDHVDRMTIFLALVPRWSDGTRSPYKQ